MPKNFFLVILVLLWSVLPAEAASVSCPSAEPGLTVQGPGFRTNPYGRSQFICRYYDRQDKKGTVEVYYYGDYRQPRDCGSRVYANADLRSWEYQIYGFAADEDPDDFLTKTYWKKLAKELMTTAEQWALPCERKRQIPPEMTGPRKDSKPNGGKIIESREAPRGQPKSVPTPLQIPSLKAVPAQMDDGW